MFIAFTMELCSRRTEYSEHKVIDTCVDHTGVNLYLCERAQTVEYERHGQNNEPPSEFWIMIDDLLNQLYEN